VDRSVYSVQLTDCGDRSVAAVGRWCNGVGRAWRELAGGCCPAGCRRGQWSLSVRSGTTDRQICRAVYNRIAHSYATTLHSTRFHSLSICTARRSEGSIVFSIVVKFFFLLNFEVVVKGQGHVGFVRFLCLHDTRGQCLALSKD